MSEVSLIRHSEVSSVVSVVKRTKNPSSLASSKVNHSSFIKMSTNAMCWPWFDTVLYLNILVPIFTSFTLLVNWEDLSVLAGELGFTTVLGSSTTEDNAKDVGENARGDVSTVF
jgi:hypothetical protein